LALFAADLVVPDLLNSWWALPCAVFDPIRNLVHVTGVTRGSALKIGTFDLGLSEVRETYLGALNRPPDDHFTPALLWDPVDGIEANEPVAVWSAHDLENDFFIRKGKSYDLDSLGVETVLTPTGATIVSYATILQRWGTPDTIVVTGRMSVSGTTGHYFMRSTDRGETWVGPYRLHGKDYFTWRLSADHKTVYCATTLHPISSSNPEPVIHAFKIDLVSGDMAALISPTVIGNLWTDTPAGTTAIVAAAEMDVVVQSSISTHSHRLLDVSPDGTAVLLANFARANLTNGTFIVRRLSGGVWSTETIGPTGTPFGYQQSFYIGGGVFDNDANTLYLVQESGGVFCLDKWSRIGGVWIKGENIRTAPAGSKIGRPRVPLNAEGLGIVTWGEYTRYASDDYRDFYGHQRIAVGG
jgi:hypothetical protein